MYQCTARVAKDETTADHVHARGGDFKNKGNYELGCKIPASAADGL